GVKIPRVGTKSWDFYYEIWSETNDRRAAHGITPVVAYDFVGHTTIEIPTQWREAIDRYESGPQEAFV
ncbi:MAG: hypothetical protein M3R51_10860, partial [Candidatus Eremiobacteraeota bacterium]|nr:hypothetical protein [Candidatus Eremiobacteraeota bacterium]